MRISPIKLTPAALRTLARRSPGLGRAMRMYPAHQAFSIAVKCQDAGKLVEPLLDSKIERVKSFQ